MVRRAAESLDETVWEAFKEIAFAVADAPTAGTMGQAIMNALARVVPCDVGSIITAEPGQPWSIAGEIGDNQLLRQNYWRYSGEMASEEAQGLAGKFAVAENVFASRRRERLAIFREFLTPLHLSHVAAAIWVVDNRVWAVGLSREGPLMSDRAIARLNALLPHLRAALRALSWLPRDPWSSNSEKEPNTGAPWGLTRMQERTMDLVIRGLTNKEVASLLGTSPHTVRNTLAEVFKKVGASRRGELAFLARSGVSEGGQSAARGALARQRAFVAAIDDKVSRG
jgi:DNA-binding CsgD family transcriptional regulator